MSNNVRLPEAATTNRNYCGEYIGGVLDSEILIPFFFESSNELNGNRNGEKTTHNNGLQSQVLFPSVISVDKNIE